MAKKKKKKPVTQIKLQIPASRLFKEADFIIDNSGSLEGLKKQVKVTSNEF